MTDTQRFERFVMRALWIIMWMLMRGKSNSSDQERVIQWRHDYYQAGGMMVEGSRPPPSMR